MIKERVKGKEVINKRNKEEEKVEIIRRENKRNEVKEGRKNGKR